MSTPSVNRQSGLFKGAEPGQPPQFKYRFLYYITHINNIQSILKEGILSHERIIQKNIHFTPIYNLDIVSMRRDKKTPDGKSLWEYANMYLQPRNAMMYLVKRNFGSNSIAILSSDRGPAYRTKGAFISDGNAASNGTSFYPVAEKNTVFKRIRSVDGLEYWKEEDGTKRMMMAEILVPDRYPPENIKTILVPNHEVKQKVEDMISSSPVKPVIVPDPRTFFDPEYEFQLTNNLSLVRGDMFFSGMHTLTVSVNTQGVMGKGLASRAKYQFPDVYIYYQDACRSKRLRLGLPLLYKREMALDNQLADDPTQLDYPNNQTWFLLFATKGEWRLSANKGRIVEGLEWLLKNYEKEGIKSLAIPALGCGLGMLQWSEMGPILCRYLSKLEIPVQLYIPSERPIPPEQLTKAFLLEKQMTLS